jgi:glutamate carboxypeptidase
VNTLDHFRRRLPGFAAELEELVGLETPTGDVPRMGEAAAWLGRRMAPFGALTVETIEGYGPMLRLRRPGAGHRVMLIGHLDTVWPVESWPELWREDGGVLRGPGVYDMKGGLLFILELLRHLDASGAAHPSLDVLITPDEEVGSIASGPRICEIAAENDLALVLEPSSLDGVIKLARKGSGEFRLTIHGRSAHQGVEPEAGVNALVEASHQITRLLAVEAPERGTTIGPNVLHAGTASNMVADRAELLVDVRAWTADEQQRIDDAIAGLEPVLDGARLELSGGWNRPPLEPTPVSMAVFERAREIGRGLGLELEWARWGGSSDGNLAAAAGTPTVDGLGPIGEGSHQRTECVVVDALPARMALFAELVTSLAEPVI